MNNFEKITENLTPKKLAKFLAEKQVCCIELMRKTKDGKLLPCPHPTNWCIPEECIEKWLLQEVEQ